MKVVFEGVNYVGKSTLIKRLQKYLIKNHNKRIEYYHDLYNTMFSKKIYSLLNSEIGLKLHDNTKLLLYLAARNEICKTKLGVPRTIYFIDRNLLTSMVFNSQEMPVNDIIALHQMFGFFYVPDVLVYIDITAEEYRKRALLRDKVLIAEHDVIEMEEQLKFYDQYITMLENSIYKNTNVIRLKHDYTNQEFENLAEKIFSKYNEKDYLMKNL